jgi:hypothetical protein
MDNNYVRELYRTLDFHSVLMLIFAFFQNLCHPFCLDDFVNTTIELKQGEEAAVDDEEIILEDDSLADTCTGFIFFKDIL